jgi:hypothetical protein
VTVHSSTEFLTRSNAVGDLGIAARIASSDRVSSLSRLLKYCRAAAAIP